MTQKKMMTRMTKTTTMNAKQWQELCILAEDIEIQGEEGYSEQTLSVLDSIELHDWPLENLVQLSKGIQKRIQTKKAIQSL